MAQLATRMAATAAATATALASGTTTAEVTALAKVLAVLGARPDFSLPPMELALSTPIDVNLTAY
jgi:hypothetical protein